MNKYIGIASIPILLSLLGYALYVHTSRSAKTAHNTPVEVSATPSPATDIQAAFAIFTNNTFRIFTAAMYHNLSQDVYIESSNPNIVHVKKAGTTWNDFFLTLPFRLTSECLTTGTKETFCTGTGGTLTFYINGERNDTALSQEIKDGDKLLVTFGSQSDEAIKQQIDRIP